MSRQIRRPSTPNDLEMTDPMASPVPSPRQPLPTSLASFALTHSSSSAPSSPSSSYTMAIDRDDLGWPPAFGSSGQNVNPLFRKLRRGSLLSMRSEDRPSLSLHSTSSSSSGSRSGGLRPSSPVGSVFPTWKDETEESGAIDDSPVESRSEGNDSPSVVAGPSGARINLVAELSGRSARLETSMFLDDMVSNPLGGIIPSPSRSDAPSTRSLEPRSPGLDPPFNPSPPASKPIDVPQTAKRLKPPRLMAVLKESSTSTDTEVQSEASFQRLVASHADLPQAFHPRTPRSAKGRFPEEVGDDDDPRRRDSDDSDDDDDDIVIGGPSGEGSLVDESRWFGEATAMDIEMASSSGSPSINSSVMHSQLSTPQPTAAAPQPLNLSWRETPQAVAVSGRSAKRKHVSDERFEPYSHPSKRRAVSPAVTIPMHHSLSGSPMSIVPRSPITSAATAVSPFMISSNTLPIGLGTPGNAPSNSGSLPSGYNNGNGWNNGGPSTPTGTYPYGAGLGVSVGMSSTRSSSVHSSPILRPVHRLPNHAPSAREREERGRTLRQVNGAASDGVKKIALAGLVTDDLALSLSGSGSSRRGSGRAGSVGGGIRIGGGSTTKHESRLGGNASGRSSGEGLGSGTGSGSRSRSEGASPSDLVLASASGDSETSPSPVPDLDPDPGSSGLGGSPGRTPKLVRDAKRTA